ncbi:MAG: hypothetical protein ACRDF7_06760 [Candidatus Limnocylindrales bacterium]
MSERDAHGDLVRRYVQASIADDFATLGALRHVEWQETWPQSGEVVPSSHAYHEARVNRPEGAPTVTMGREWGGSGDQWWAEMVVDYPDGSRWLATSLFELRDGLVYRERIYFGQPFPAPAWRARWVQQGPPAIG